MFIKKLPKGILCRFHLVMDVNTFFDMLPSQFNSKKLDVMSGERGLCSFDLDESASYASFKLGARKDEYYYVYLQANEAICSLVLIRFLKTKIEGNQLYRNIAGCVYHVLSTGKNFYDFCSPPMLEENLLNELQLPEDVVYSVKYSTAEHADVLLEEIKPWEKSIPEIFLESEETTVVYTSYDDPSNPKKVNIPFVLIREFTFDEMAFILDLCKNSEE